MGTMASSTIKGIQAFSSPCRKIRLPPLVLLLHLAVGAVLMLLLVLLVVFAVAVGGAAVAAGFAELLLSLPAICIRTLL
jgi:hypothetical protein